MRLLNIAAVVLLAFAPGAAMAATAHNSSNGNYGLSSNAGDATLSSPHVKHAAKHKTMQKGM